MNNYNDSCLQYAQEQQWADQQVAQYENNRASYNRAFSACMEGRGWTMFILEENGKMSSTVSDEDVGFVVFGACTKN